MSCNTRRQQFLLHTYKTHPAVQLLLLSYTIETNSVCQSDVAFLDFCILMVCAFFLYYHPTKTGYWSCWTGRTANKNHASS